MKLASIFTDHMVLQKGLPVRVFGEGAGCVTVSFLGNSVTERFFGTEWCVSLPACDWGGPYEMLVSLDGEETRIRDIYVGEVWIAGGQSNMEMPLFRTEYGFTEAKHSYNEKIRFFDVPRRVERDVPKYGWPFIATDGEDTPWEICREKSALRASAIAYYAAKELNEALGVAIGIIGCNWGSRNLETFISRDYADRCPSLRKMLDEYHAMVKRTDMAAYRKELDDMYAFIKMRVGELDYDEIERTRALGFARTWPCPLAGYPACYKPGPNHPNGIGVLYESMLARIVPYGTNGFLWYQGESNGGDYDEKFAVFMQCMKERFQNPAMKFYSVEIAPYAYSGTSLPDDRFVTDPTNKAFTREAQQRAAKFPDNHMITTIDLGDIVDIHPLNKAPLAHRMVKKMLRYSYGFDVKCEQPVYESAEFRDGKAYIRLKYADGLMTPGRGGGVKIFIADETRQLKRAKLVIDGDTLILSHPEIRQPILARYAFDSYYLGDHLYNDAGLPLGPFRTDGG